MRRDQLSADPWWASQGKSHIMLIWTQPREQVERGELLKYFPKARTERRSSPRIHDPDLVISGLSTIVNDEYSRGSDKSHLVLVNFVDSSARFALE